METRIPSSANLYELNHLAQRLASLEGRQLDCFEGLVEMDVAKGAVSFPVERLINLTHSTDTCNFAFRVYSDKALGKFYVDNDFPVIPENLPKILYEMLDYEAIGRKQRNSEGGVFTSGGYVVRGGEVAEIYHSGDAVPTKLPEHTILLEVKKGFFNDPEYDNKLQYRLGWMLQNGVGTEKNIAAAKVYFEKAATVGNPFACYALAKLILTDEHALPSDVEKALGYLRQAVEAENPYAAYFLGKLYEQGQHVPKNEAEAVRLYKLSAAQDNDFAAYCLGRLYLGGGGILKDVGEAIRWLDFAAEKKNQFAEYALGVLYLKGEDIPKDANRAIGYLRRSAAQENQFAQYRLGKVYLTGEDAPKDVDAALCYLTAAADQGNQYAEYTLGKLYLMGKDVPKDKEAAVKWFTRSAAQGNIYARFLLDHMDEFKEASAFLCATRLLHHMSRIIGDTEPARAPPNPLVDTKLRRKIKEKKQAQGHARDDHEQTMSL